MTPVKKAMEVFERLQEYYGQPTWRDPKPPIDELVSTILSQNTNDNNRDRAYTALRAKFPTWEQVRDAPTRQVIAAIRPAGLAKSCRSVIFPCREAPRARRCVIL